MSYISHDPYWWPFLDWNRISSYFLVASSAVVAYDWALAFGQEVELVWMQHWSLMTVLYICVRYIGLLYCVINMLWYLNSVSMTNAVGILYDARHPLLLIQAPYRGAILWFTLVWMTVVVNAMLGVVMMTRIHAMYGRSKRMLIFLIVVLMASTITTGVMVIVAGIGVSGEKRFFSGTNECAIVFADIDAVHLHETAWIPAIMWELIAFCLVVWIVVDHFRELRQHGPTGLTIRDYVTVLIKTHLLYFVSFAAVSCLYLGPLSPELSSDSLEIYFGIINFAQPVQMFVLGPRLVLSVRQYHAELAAEFDEGTNMTAHAFQEHGHLLLSSGV